MISFITDPSLVRGGRTGGKIEKKSVGDFKVVVRKLVLTAMKKL